ncbi:MAG: lipoyl-dependent peroxiredoxin [Candidatus Phytoplasma cynodontis]|uniref:OsmC family protein n=1 Tax='Cynodon dactylon' phytoplasma TaxID=295320 RepID=UPI001265BF94|nr:OsmC family protein ['Cynodon dactylon' phytoplasma]KAB8121894.1 hypothetical protein F1741_01425 ['Cynodon dactylon' phytoplasma]WIA07778.1 MAG: lipoyl-dependent peroxiredoxin [Candidatus Phytoplasma cynodontis]
MKTNNNFLKIMICFDNRINELLILNNGVKYRLNSFLNNRQDEFISPKELFCLSLIICFYKTTYNFLSKDSKIQKEDIKSKIFCKVHKDDLGFYFKINLFLGIKNFALSETEKVISYIHKKCPISRLLEKYDHIILKPISYEEIDHYE